MGIKELWTILTPFCERKPLYELQGKVVAIDLSGWVCQAQCITEYQVQPRMYLRNLYFRTCFMLLQEITPVFILEGKAPTMKYNTIAARNAIQFKGAKPRTEGSNAPAKAGKDRSRFNHTLKLCEEMLKLMGLACITGVGEAEAMCAYLNEEGMVDGCISQDSDCFAYGAKIVYRNFSISQQGAHAASGGSVDVYDLSKASDAIDFGRNKIVVLALLCGSDYSNGVAGIGKDAVTKLFATVSDKDALEHIKSWRNKTSLYADFEKNVTDKNVCTSCGHFGKLASHTKIGCQECGTHKGCDFSKYKSKRLEIKNEVNIRRKALEDPDFPDSNILQEFLVRKDNISKLDLRWKRPDVIKFVKFTRKYLEWDELYIFEKILPILTRWQVYQKDTTRSMLLPQCIKKKRAPKGVPSYEIIWKDNANNFENVIPANQLEGVDLIKLYSSIEPQHLIDKAYPDVVQKYQESKLKPKIVKKRKVKKVSTGESPIKKISRKSKKKLEEKVIDELENSFHDLGINIKNSDGDKVKTEKPKQIDSYFKKAVLNSYNNKAKTCFDPDMSCFGDENDDYDADISGIIDDIVSQGLPVAVQMKLNELGEKMLADTNETEFSDDMNRSSFFISKPSAGEMDLFEASFQNAASSDDSSDTEDYDFTEMVVQKELTIEKNRLHDGNLVGSQELLSIKEKVINCEQNENIIKSSPHNVSLEANDSFSLTYVPLFERLKKRK